MKTVLKTLVLAGCLLYACSYATDVRASGIAASFGHAAPHIAAGGNELMLAGGERGERPEHRGKDWEKKQQKIMERIGDLPPEQQEKARKRLEEMRSKREQIRAELEALPPEEREARMEQLREQYRKNREEHSEAFHQEFQLRWEDATPEERAVFCDKAQERCDEGGMKACDFVGDACGE